MITRANLESEDEEKMKNEKVFCGVAISPGEWGASFEPSLRGGFTGHFLVK